MLLRVFIGFIGGVVLSKIIMMGLKEWWGDDGNM